MDTAHIFFKKMDTLEYHLEIQSVGLSNRLPLEINNSRAISNISVLVNQFPKAVDVTDRP
jgi:hypothetical protein